MVHDIFKKRSSEFAPWLSELLFQGYEFIV